MEYLIEFKHVYGNRATARCKRQVLIELLEKQYISIYSAKLVNPELDNLEGIKELKKAAEGIW